MVDVFNCIIMKLDGHREPFDLKTFSWLSGKMFITVFILCESSSTKKGGC